MEGTQTLDESLGSGRHSARPSRRHRAGQVRRSALVALLVSTGALALAACGGGPATPGVAGLGPTTTGGADHGTGGGGGGGGGSVTTTPKGDATALLDGWATCMRRHGDPDQADPTVDANGVIHITWNPAIPGGYEGTNRGGQGNLGPGQYCRQYLSQAQSALDGGEPPQLPTDAQLVAFAKCMRANGIADFPDPIDGNLSFNLAAGGDLNPNDPAFQNASKLCVQKTGAHVPGAGSPPPGTIEINGAEPPGIGGAGIGSGTGAGG